MSQQVLLANDMPGVAKVAGMSNLPILAAAQFEVALLPTLLLSTHTVGYEGLVTHSPGDAFGKILNHWDQLDVQFKGALTGYFADTDQIDTMVSYFTKHPMPLIVDPIMADFGELYLGFAEDFPEKMKPLVAMADVTVPNVTEACFLTDTPYDQVQTFEDHLDLARAVRALGAKNVVLSGVPLEDADEIGVLIITPDQEVTLSQVRVEEYFKGNGDLFVSLVMSFYLLGLDVVESVKRSLPYMEQALLASTKVKRDKKLGIYCEAIIPAFSAEIAALRQASE